jgi:hypothetical protein
MDNPKQERRNEARRRRRALKRARITFKGRCATIDCTVLNLSDVGACLKVESPDVQALATKRWGEVIRKGI